MIYYCYLPPLNSKIERLKNNNREFYKIDGNNYRFLGGKWVKNTDYFEKVGFEYRYLLEQCKTIFIIFDILFAINIINTFDLNQDVLRCLKLTCLKFLDNNNIIFI